MRLKSILATLLLVLFSACGFAQGTGSDDIRIAPGDYYTIKPDYRRCASPYCGGWWLTRVNQYSRQVDAAVLDSNSSIAPIYPRPIYVAKIDYSLLNLTRRQIAVFERNIHAGRGFIRGQFRPYSGGGGNNNFRRLVNLLATGTWLAANDNAAVGPFLNVNSSGIVCVTTPCPYYKVEVLNTRFTTPAHELNLKRAELTDRQTAQAWRELSQQGLIMTGVRFVSQGQVGTGLGIAATKVFFAYPGSIRPSK